MGLKCILYTFQLLQQVLIKNVLGKLLSKQVYLGMILYNLYFKQGTQRFVTDDIFIHMFVPDGLSRINYCENTKLLF